MLHLLILLVTLRFQPKMKGSWLRNRKHEVIKVIAKVAWAFHAASATWPLDLRGGLITARTGILHADRYEVSISMQLTLCFLLEIPYLELNVETKSSLFTVQTTVTSPNFHWNKATHEIRQGENPKCFLYKQFLSENTLKNQNSNTI